ncbi:MAG: M14 family zinc carboxypeptidase, partial [Bryobacteraceae bacterium]
MRRTTSLLLAAALLSFSSLGVAQTQKNDEGYTAKIREYTTDKAFITELVDHLPESATVPTPEKVLGYIAGAPNKLTYTKDIYRYMREIEKTSKRVKVFSIGRSEEGRETLLVAISDEANLAKLDRYKQITAALADPRKTPDAEAKKLIAEGLPIYWATGSIHSPETGSPEMLMELAYRLAVEETPFIQHIRKNLIVMLTPSTEVDGRDRMVDLYNWKKENPGRQAPSLLYWGKYVAHDNNRDSMSMALQLSKIVMSTFLDYHPTVLHDLHESVPFLYTSTGMGPYNAWLDPIVVNEWQKMAYYEIEEMTKRGVIGVWTHGFYDGWAPNYMFYAANGHNSIGRFYETFGNGGADTQDRTVPANQTTRTWFRPNPPLPKVKWSMRNNNNMQQSAILLAMNYTATNKSTFLENFYTKGKRSVAKATTEGPAAWVLPSDETRPAEAADLMRLMQLQGVEVQKTTVATEVSEKG